MSPLDVLLAAPYNLFYSLAVAVAAWAAYEAGRRRGWSSSRWALAVGAWVAGGVVGAMLPHALFGDVIAYRTSIGAVIGATIALAILAPWFGRVPDVLDSTAVAVPLGAAIVRVGCFLAGCCQGVLTTLPTGNAAHPGEAPRHAVQLYEAILDAIAAAWLTRRGDRVRPGEQFATSIGAMAAIRFATEFLRDNEKYSGLSLAQWVVLPVGLVCLMAPVARRPMGTSRRALTPSARGAAIALTGALVLAAFVVRLPALESTVLLIGASLLLALIARTACRVAPTGFAVLALQMPALSADTTYPRVYTFFGGGGSMGSWDYVHQFTSCDGTVNEQWSRHHSSFGSALEMGWRRQFSRTRRVTIRSRGYVGMESIGAAEVRQGVPPDPAGYDRQTYGLSVVGDADWKYVGLSLGVSAGQLYPMSEDFSSSPSSDHPDPVESFPAIGVRIGRLDGFSLETRIADESPMWIPGPTASFGFALGDSLGNRIRGGVSDGGYFVAGSRMMPSGLEVSPIVMVSASGTDPARNVFYGGVMIRKWIRAGRPFPVGR